MSFDDAKPKFSGVYDNIIQSRKLEVTVVTVDGNVKIYKKESGELEIGSDELKAPIYSACPGKGDWYITSDELKAKCSGEGDEYSARAMEFHPTPQTGWEKDIWHHSIPCRNLPDKPTPTGGRLSPRSEELRDRLEDAWRKEERVGNREVIEQLENEFEKRLIDQLNGSELLRGTETEKIVQERFDELLTGKKQVGCDYRWIYCPRCERRTVAFTDKAPGLRTYWCKRSTCMHSFDRDTSGFVACKKCYYCL